MKVSTVWFGIVAVFAFVAVAFGSDELTAQSTYKVTVFDVPSSTGTCAASINNAGSVVGSYLIGTGAQVSIRGFQRSADGTITEVSPPLAASISRAYGINSHLIVGDYTDASGTSHGFTFDGEQYTTVDIDGIATELTSISNNGLIGGAYFPGQQGSSAFVESPRGEIFSLLPEYTYVQVNGVNDSGQVVGGVSDGIFDGGNFVYSPTTGYKQIKYPGGEYTFTNGINDAGIIVGDYNAIGSKVTIGFLLKDGTFTAFQFKDSYSTVPFAINDHGDIAGCYTEVNNMSHGFVATFVPSVPR